MTDQPSTAGMAVPPPAMRSVPCNLCGSAEVRTIRESTGSGRVVQCRRCGLAYVSPRLAGDPRTQYEVDEYHEKARLATGRPGYTSYAGDRPILYPYFGERAAEIAQVKPGARILEVGAASGYFLEQARAHGMRPDGIEPSKACQRIIRDELGIPVVAGSLEEAAIEPSTYDAVALFQTIEHFADPRGGLQKMARWLKPGGLIMITTPDRGAWFSRLTGKRWFEYKPHEHLYYFDERTITRMLEAVGFERITVRRDVNRYSVAFLYERLQRYYPALAPVIRGLRRITPQRLRALGIPVHYGSMKVTAHRAGLS
ncbi:MAG: class I SAM-dependent methyltransferase [Dehalococcoidia bacterium]|nr:class I SAM-dependent methyltransferase [Dehalococcoidia bacterium]